MAGLDDKVLRHALATARERGFRKVSLRVGEERFSAVLGDDPETVPAGAVVDESQALVIDEPGPRVVEIVAPVVGYVQQGKVSLETGQAVTAGDIVFEIVALGIPNDVVSTQDGEVTEVLVDAGDPVEYGQVLAKLRTS